MTSASLLTGGGDWERYTITGACNEPLPSNWANACRRVAGHGGEHHTWDPRTGMDRRRHPLPAYDISGKRVSMVLAWGNGYTHETRMLRGHGAYVASSRVDRLIVKAKKARERPFA